VIGEHGGDTKRLLRNAFSKGKHLDRSNGKAARIPVYRGWVPVRGKSGTAKSIS